MTILAFFQNMWVESPKAVYKMLDRNKDNPMFWNQTCKNLMFMGCKTGRVLRQAFGDLADKMIYDECTKEICNNPKTIPKADYKHIRETIKRIKPEIIITFGEVAFKAVNWEHGRLRNPAVLIKCPHPAARQVDTATTLRMTAEAIQEYIKYNKGCSVCKAPNPHWVKIVYDFLCDKCDGELADSFNAVNMERKL